MSFKTLENKEGTLGPVAFSFLLFGSPVKRSYLFFKYDRAKPVNMRT